LDDDDYDGVKCLLQIKKRIERIFKQHWQAL